MEKCKRMMSRTGARQTGHLWLTLRSVLLDIKRFMHREHVQCPQGITAVSACPSRQTGHEAISDAAGPGVAAVAMTAVVNGAAAAAAVALRTGRSRSRRLRAGDCPVTGVSGE